MITLICGTNRPNNESQKFVELYKNVLLQRGLDSNIVFLEELPDNFAFANDIIGSSSKELKEIIDNKIIPAKTLIVVTPEYNGSYPGVLKSFIDCVEPKHYKDKTVALVGVSAGRSGNLRGMDHLTGVFHYLGANVLSTKIDVANIHSILDEDKKPNDDGVIRRVNRQIDHILKF